MSTMQSKNIRFNCNISKDKEDLIKYTVTFQLEPKSLNKIKNGINKRPFFTFISVWDRSPYWLKVLFRYLINVVIKKQLGFFGLRDID